MSLTSSHLSPPLPLPTIMTDTAGVAHIIVSGPEITKQWMWSTDGDYMWERNSRCNYHLLQRVTVYYRNPRGPRNRQTLVQFFYTFRQPLHTALALQGLLPLTWSTWEPVYHQQTIYCQLLHHVTLLRITVTYEVMVLYVPPVASSACLPQGLEGERPELLVV